MLATEIYAVIKICKEISDWVDSENAKINAGLDQIPELNILEARKKIKKLKKILDETK